MRPHLPEGALKRANPWCSFRPSIGMRALKALAGLAALTALPACFNPALSCRLLCGDHGSCPAGLTCQVVSNTPVCVAHGDTCPASEDAGSNDDTATDSLSADAVAEAHPAPTDICTDQTHCIHLSPAVQSGLVLWLDPSNLPTLKDAVTVWPDRSGQGNDARASAMNVPPTSIMNGVAFAKDSFGAGFTVAAHPSLDFGTGDFLVLVLAAATDGTAGGFYIKTDNNVRTTSHQIVLRWTFDAALNAYQPQALVNDTALAPNAPVAAMAGMTLFGLRRVKNQIEIRVNGSPSGTAALIAPDTSTDDPNDLLLGQLGDVGPSIDSMRAVIAIRGPIDDSDLSGLEDFLAQLQAEP